MHFLLKLPTPVSLLIIIAVTTSLALAGLFAVRRRYSPEELKENHEVAAIIFGAFGWLYAVVVAFVVFVTWSGFDEANKNLQLEVSQALDIFNDAEAFTGPVGNNVRHAIINYMESVANHELPMMESENMELYSSSSLRNLRQLLNSPDSFVVPNKELYSASLRRVDSLMEYRRLRIFSGRNNVPSLIWLVLVVGGVITVANTYFFGMKHTRVQAFMTATLTIMLTLVLYLIFVLDHPFTGTNRVSEDPLQQALAIMRSKLLPASATR
jgi:hypothetical protein